MISVKHNKAQCTKMKYACILVSWSDITKMANRKLRFHSTTKINKQIGINEQEELWENSQIHFKKFSNTM